MSIDAALSRIDQIAGLQQQLMDPSDPASSTGGSAVAPTASTANTTSTSIGSTTAPSATDATSATDFANALAAAQAPSTSTDVDPSTTATTPSLGESNDSALLNLMSSLGTSGDSTGTSGADATETPDDVLGGATTADALGVDPGDPTATLAAMGISPDETTAATDPATATAAVPAAMGISSDGTAATPAAMGLTPASTTTATTDPDVENALAAQSSATATQATQVTPATSPTDPRIEGMQQEADSLVGKPYIYGGGHGSWGPQSGYDCSGFVSAVLHAGGYLSAPQDTTSLPSAAGMESGPGQYVTVYDRSQPGQEGHVIIDINGQFYESGGEAGSWGGGGGVEKISTPSASYLSTFNDILHPAGL